MQPKVSIIVPVYNVEKYLERCINSLRNQTLSDIERSREAVYEHKSIMEAMRDGNSELAEKLADEHICNAYRNMIKCGLSAEKE